MREELQKLVDDVLNPLLEKDASSIELVSIGDGEVVAAQPEFDLESDAAERSRHTLQ